MPKHPVQMQLESLRERLSREPADRLAHWMASLLCEEAGAADPQKALDVSHCATGSMGFADLMLALQSQWDLPELNLFQVSERGVELRFQGQVLLLTGQGPDRSTLPEPLPSAQPPASTSASTSPAPTPRPTPAATESRRPAAPAPSAAEVRPPAPASEPEPAQPSPFRGRRRLEFD